MYSYDFRVGFSQADVDQRMTVTAMVDEFQDVSCFHSDELGVGFNYLRPQGLVWLISYWELEIIKTPMYFDKLTVGTYPYDFKGFFGYRNFYLKDEQGDYCVKADSLWIFMDVASQSPRKILPKMAEAYKCKDKLDMEYHKRHIVVPADIQAETTDAEPIEVAKYHLDFNGHVNNGQYVKMAVGLLPREITTKRLRVEYRKQAFLGDVIYPHIVHYDDKYMIALNDAEGTAYCNVEVTYA